MCDIAATDMMAWTAPSSGAARAASTGTLDTFSLLIDYRPVRRVDLYAGVSLSNVYAGLANGYQATQNIDPTVGVRIKF